MTLRVGVLDGPSAPPDLADRCVRSLEAAACVDLVRLAPVDHRRKREEAARLRSARLDALLDLTGADFAAGWEPIARYGVWSFHHGDGEAWVAGPVGRWQPHCRRPALPVALLATVGPRRRVLQAGCFAAGSTTWARALAGIVQVVAEWPAKVCREACLLGEDPLGRAREAPVRVVPLRRGIADLPRAAGRRLHDVRSRLRAQWRRWRRDQWTIGIVRAPIHTFLARPGGYSVTWLPERSRHEYVADPFAVGRGATTTILVERFDRRTRLGQLCALEGVNGIEAGPSGPPRPILPLPTHQSYPCLFESEGRLYCVPEMFQSNAVHLFGCVELPARWRHVATLLDDFPGVDPTLFRHEGRFWLLCTRLTTPGSDQLALYAWWATALTGPWTPHARNPVKYDVRSARPAGAPFEHAGRLFRPAQDCSETYGGAIRINRIDRLTPEDYDEETVAIVRPDPRGRYPAGLHTMTALGDWTLIDGKRRVWSLPRSPRGIGSHPDSAALSLRLAGLRD